MFDVARQALQLPQSRVQDWMDLDPGKRAPWLPRADLRASAALLLLEQAALRRQQLLSRDELKRRFFGHDAESHANTTAARAALLDVRRLEDSLSRPAALLPDAGYGLPQAQERATLAQESNRQVAQWREQSDWLRTEARQWLSPERQAALAGTETNLETLGEQLRRLNKEQDGIELHTPE
jgi:hypothetical protein